MYLLSISAEFWVYIYEYRSTMSWNRSSLNERLKDDLNFFLELQMNTKKIWHLHPALVDGAAARMRNSFTVWTLRGEHLLLSCSGEEPLRPGKPRGAKSPNDTCFHVKVPNNTRKSRLSPFWKIVARGVWILAKVVKLAHSERGRLQRLRQRESGGSCLPLPQADSGKKSCLQIIIKKGATQ